MEDFEEIKRPIIARSYRAFDIQVGGDSIREVGLLKLIWGTDIWINNVPMLKCIVAANIMVWILLFVV